MGKQATDSAEGTGISWRRRVSTQVFKFRVKYTFDYYFAKRACAGARELPDIQPPHRLSLPIV
jgi:hypothetical protein